MAQHLALLSRGLPVREPIASLLHDGSVEPDTVAATLRARWRDGGNDLSARAQAERAAGGFFGAILRVIGVMGIFVPPRPCSPESGPSPPNMPT